MQTKIVNLPVHLQILLVLMRPRTVSLWLCKHYMSIRVTLLYFRGLTNVQQIKCKYKLKHTLLQIPATTIIVNKIVSNNILLAMILGVSTMLTIKQTSTKLLHIFQTKSNMKGISIKIIIYSKKIRSHTLSQHCSLLLILPYLLNKVQIQTQTTIKNNALYIMACE